MLRLDPGEGRVATTRTLRRLGGRRRVQRRARAEALLRPRHRARHGARRQPGRPPGRGSDLTRAASTRARALGAVRRRRPRGSQRAQLHRARLRRRAAPSAAPTAATPRSRSCGRATIDWDAIFGREGARWLHTGGIFCALSETTAAVAREAMEAARRHGTVVSYDLNYRDSLWRAIGGHERAAEVNRELVPLVDVLSATRRTSPPRSASRSRASTSS